MMQAKSSNQGLMRKQMNALRAQIKKNRADLDRMKARDNEKEAALIVFSMTPSFTYDSEKANGKS